SGREPRHVRRMHHWRSAVAPYRRRRPLDGSEDQLRAVSLWGHDVMPLLRAAGPGGQGNGDRPLDPPRQGRSRSRASGGSLPLEDRTDALVRELEARERAAARELAAETQYGGSADVGAASWRGDDLVPF